MEIDIHTEVLDRLSQERALKLGLTGLEKKALQGEVAHKQTIAQDIRSETEPDSTNTSGC